MMAAGKAATADSCVMVARSCDAHGGDQSLKTLAVPRKKHHPGEVIRFPESEGVIIPQVPETYSYIAVLSDIEGMDIAEAEGGINEFQVSAGASTGGLMNTKALEKSPKMSTSLGDYRTTLVLERAKTAREGIKLIGEMTGKYGARTDNYIVADPKEAWLYEEYQGRLWAAVRVPDDCFTVEANTVRIDRVDFDDPDNFMGSKDLVSFAIENGLYDPDGGEPFNPMKVYGAQTGKVRHGIPAPEYDRRRIWRSISLLAPSTKLDPEEQSWVYPLFVEPDRKLTPKDLLDVFRDHYQGTKYDNYGENANKYKATMSAMRAGGSQQVVQESPFHINKQRGYQLAPIWGTERIIGTPRAITTWCAQLRDWIPNPVGGLFWAGVSEGATTAHIPWYVGVTRTPEAFTLGTRKKNLIEEGVSGSMYDEKCAYWKFRVITNLVNLFYTALKDEVIPVWSAWEDKLHKLQPMIEEVALDLYKKDSNAAIDFLTDYSCAKATEALEMANEMITRLHTIIAHYNAPL
jgi:dipeptidase